MKLNVFKNKKKMSEKYFFEITQKNLIALDSTRYKTNYFSWVYHLCIQYIFAFIKYSKLNYIFVIINIPYIKLYLKKVALTTF